MYGRERHDRCPLFSRFVREGGDFAFLAEMIALTRVAHFSRVSLREKRGFRPQSIRPNLARCRLLFYHQTDAGPCSKFQTKIHAAPDRQIPAALRAGRNRRSDRDGGHRPAARLLRPQNPSLPRVRVARLHATRDQLKDLRPRLLPRRKHIAMGQPPTGNQPRRRSERRDPHRRFAGAHSNCTAFRIPVNTRPSATLHRLTPPHPEEKFWGQPLSAVRRSLP